MGISMPTCPNCGEKGFLLHVFSEPCDFCHLKKCVKCGENKLTFITTSSKIDNGFNEYLKKHKIPKYLPGKKMMGMNVLNFCSPSCYFKFVEQLLLVPHCELSSYKNREYENRVVFKYPDLNTEIDICAGEAPENVEKIMKMGKAAEKREEHNEQVRRAISDIEAHIKEGDSLSSGENFEKACASFEEGIRLCNKVTEWSTEWKFDYDVSDLRNQLIERSKVSQRKLKEEKQTKVLVDQSTSHIEYKTEVISHKGDNIHVGKVGDDVKIENSVIQRSSIGGGKQVPQISICPYCGKDLDFPKPPKYCPFCKEQILKT